MSDIAEAFSALEHLDRDGQKALNIATMALKEKLPTATARARRAEWLLRRLDRWASGWGLEFDLEGATARYDREHPQEPATLSPWFESHVAAELHDLRARLNDALDGRETAEMRAEAAEMQLTKLYLRS